MASDWAWAHPPAPLPPPGHHRVAGCALGWASTWPRADFRQPESRHAIVKEAAAARRLYCVRDVLRYGAGDRSVVRGHLALASRRIRCSYSDLGRENSSIVMSKSALVPSNLLASPRCSGPLPMTIVYRAIASGVFAAVNTLHSYDPIHSRPVPNAADGISACLPNNPLLCRTYAFAIDFHNRMSCRAIRAWPRPTPLEALLRICENNGKQATFEYGHDSRQAELFQDRHPDTCLLGPDTAIGDR